MMSEARNFRRWAAQVARQAGEEPDANEAQRLLSIAEYWVRLAEMEDWQRDRPGQDTSHSGLFRFIGARVSRYLLHGCCDDRRARRGSTPPSGSRTSAVVPRRRVSCRRC